MFSPLIETKIFKKNQNKTFFTIKWELIKLQVPLGMHWKADFFSQFYGQKKSKNIFFKMFFYNKMRSNKATELTGCALESWESHLSNEQPIIEVTTPAIRGRRPPCSAWGRHVRPEAATLGCGLWPQVWPTATKWLKSQYPVHLFWVIDW